MKKHRFVIGLLLIFSFFSIDVWAVDNLWETREPMQQARTGLSAAVVEGKIYAIGGYSRGLGDDKNLGTNEEYDPITDSWTYKEPMPTPRSGFGIAVVDNKIYCICGWTETNETATNEVYDPMTDTWETKTSMPTPRADITASAVNGKIVVTGGNYMIQGEYFTTNVTEVYDPTTDSWTSENPVPNAVSSYASAVIDNKIYIIGGHNLDLGVKYSLTQIYDTETDNWSQGIMLPYATYYAAAGSTTGTMALERIYVLGGANNGLNQIYDPKNDNWTNGTTIPTSRINLAVAVINDTIYALGGDHYPTTGPTASCTTNEHYTPADYVPEFPTQLILPILLITAVMAIVLRQKIYRTSTQQSY